MKSNVKEVFYEKIDDEDFRDLLENIVELEEEKRKKTHMPKGIKKEIKENIINYLRKKGKIA
ncbi:MAG: hypothetical protein V5A68_02465 [Candidatus Thermoplasmatota archaeon]